MKNMQEEIFKKRFRLILDKLYEGEPATAMPLLYIRHNFKDHLRIFDWMLQNGIRGRRLVEFFQNESNDDDGGGFIRGISIILSRMEGTKHYHRPATIEDLRKL